MERRNDRFGMKDRSAARDEFLQQIVLRRAAQLGPRHAVLFGDDQVEREEERRGRVDRHRGVDRLQRDSFEQPLHVLPMANRDARLADFAARDWSVGVVAVLRGQVERDRKSALTLLQVREEALVGLARVAEAGIGADDPRLARRASFLFSVRHRHKVSYRGIGIPAELSAAFLERLGSYLNPRKSPALMVNGHGWRREREVRETAC